MKNIYVRILLFLLWAVTVAILSTSFAVAYIILPSISKRACHHPSHRHYHCWRQAKYNTKLYTSQEDDNSIQTSSSQQQSSVLDSISYRKVNENDIPTCFRIEFTSYPLDESASIDNLYYRQRVAGDYFWIATLPTNIANEYITKQSTDTDEDTTIIGYICSTRCNEFVEESMSTHDANGSILAIHSVVVDEPYRRMGVASAMMQNYLKEMIPFSSFNANTRESGFERILLLAKAHLLGFYVDNGFMVLRPSPIVHGSDTWYELEARQYHLERMIRMQAMNTSPKQQYPSTTSQTRSFDTYSRSTANPDEEIDEAFIYGRDQRRDKLHAELIKLGINPTEFESHPERCGTSAVRTYNSFLLPKSKGALAVAESPTRARVVANNISFLVREHKADQEEWLRNVDQNRNTESADEGQSNSNTKEKHPIVIVLDNIRSAHNVGNILRLAEASQVESVRLCGMTPRPPHPKVLKTAMGAAKYVSLGTYDGGEKQMSTLETVRDLKAKGYKVYGVETTENATSYDQIKDDDNTPVAYVFGNELIGVDVDVLKECDNIICLPTYGIKNSLNIASCVAIIVWDRLKLINQSYN